MNWGSPEFVLVIIAISTFGWLANNWIRARHGYALEDEWGGKTKLPQQGATEELRAENVELREQIVHFSDRVKILEGIVTDRGYEVSGQIEALRDARQTEGRR